MEALRAGASERGQMVVELAVVLPVMLAVMVIACDCMAFMGESARFDQLAFQQVLAEAASPARDAYPLEERMQRAQESLSSAFDGTGQSVRIEWDAADTSFGDMVTCRCTLRMAPWPLDVSGGDVFGIGAPVHLEHVCTFAFDPYTPGKL